MSSECLFNKLVKFHKMNVQIHSYRYCRVWNKKELGQMGLLKTPNQGYVEQTHRKVLQTTEINWMKNNPSNGTMNYLDRCIIAIHCEAREIE